jgi:hypothetical protein
MSVPELLRVDYWHAEKLVSRPSRGQQKRSQLRSIVQISATAQHSRSLPLFVRDRPEVLSEDIFWTSPMTCHHAEHVLARTCQAQQ